LESSNTSATVTVSNAADGTLAWTASSNDPAVTVSPGSYVGNSKAAIISADDYSEDYTATVTFSNADDNSDTASVTVNVEGNTDDEGEGESIPAPPDNIQASDETHSDRIVVTWSDVAKEDGYHISASTNSTTGYELVGTVGANVIQFEHLLSPDQARWYQVTAYNDAGESEPGGPELGWTAPESDDCDLLWEDFDDGAAQDWATDLGGDWQVIDGEYCQLQTAVYGYDRTSVYSSFGSGEWADYLLSADFRFIEGTNSTNAIYFSFRYQDSNNYYRVQFQNIFGASDALYVFKVEGGVSTTLHEDAIGVDEMIQNHVDITARGSSFQIELNGTEVYSFSDAAHTAGSIGLASGHIAVAFDNVCVSAIAGGGGGSAPATPTNVQASDETHSDRIVVTWSDVTDETGYRIYASTNSTEGYSLVGTVGADVTQFEHMLGVDQARWYEVTAYNSAGESEPGGPELGWTGAAGDIICDDFDDGPYFSWSFPSEAGYWGDWNPNSFASTPSGTFRGEYACTTPNVEVDDGAITMSIVDWSPNDAEFRVLFDYENDTSNYMVSVMRLVDTDQMLLSVDVYKDGLQSGWGQLVSEWTYRSGIMLAIEQNSDRIVTWLWTDLPSDEPLGIESPRTDAPAGSLPFFFVADHGMIEIDDYCLTIPVGKTASPSMPDAASSTMITTTIHKVAKD
jgi:hypothetical protein